MSGPGQTDQGAIQRAELFKDVDDLKAWKKMFDFKQAELIQWQIDIRKDLQNTLDGCNLLLEADVMLSNRIDIVNKRLRHIEKAVERLTPR